MQGIVNGVAQQEDKNGVIEAIKEPLPQPLPEEGGECYVLQLYSIWFLFPRHFTTLPLRGGAGGEASFSSFLFGIVV